MRCGLPALTLKGTLDLHDCLSCGHLMPIAAGQAKVDRNVAMGSRLFLEQLH